MKLHTYTNNFHGTTARSKYSPEELYTEYVRACASGDTTHPAYKAVQRLRRKLCGIKGCECSDWKGER